MISHSLECVPSRDSCPVGHIPDFLISCQEQAGAELCKAGTELCKAGTELWKTGDDLCTAGVEMGSSCLINWFKWNPVA